MATHALDRIMLTIDTNRNEKQKLKQTYKMQAFSERIESLWFPGIADIVAALAGMKSLIAHPADAFNEA